MSAYFANKLRVVPITLTLISATFGLWLGELGWALFLASLVWIFIHTSEYRKYLQWSRHPLKRPPNGIDRWFLLIYPLFRSLQRERGRTRDMTKRLREILRLTEVIPDAVIILTPTGDIEGMNDAARKLLSLSDRDVGLGLATVLRNPDFVTFIRENQLEEPLEFTSPFNAGQSLEARRFDTGNERTIVLVRDITALNRLLTMRQNFVANVSHELRTPLTVVAGYLETMLDETQDAELRLSLISRLETPVKRLQNLVNDLMLLTQLESTSSKEQKRPVNLAKLVETCVQELSPLTRTTNQISVIVEDEVLIPGIDTELQSVCFNLLTNALRYSPEGNPITISVKKHHQAVRLSVKDQGYGIAPEHLDRLTERFYRVDLAGARSRGGTGLGLAIVKHILRRHGSELNIQSTLGHGSTFFCDFESIEAA
jgi:two-component system phosphate regulon sensor histidine kinase PhoR